MNMSHSSCTVNGGVKPTVACRQQYSPLCQHWEKGGFRDPQLMTAFSVCSLIFVALPIALNTSSSITLLWTVAEEASIIRRRFLSGLSCSDHLLTAGLQRAFEPPPVVPSVPRELRHAICVDWKRCGVLRDSLYYLRESKLVQWRLPGVMRRTRT